MVKAGTLIDASLVEADCRRPRQGESVEHRSDRDASWNALPEKPLFGYKMHLAVDHGSGLVRRAMLTPGHVSDKVSFLDLVQGDEQTVGACPRAGLRPDPGADRGYDGWWYRQELARRGIADGSHGGQLPAAAAGGRRSRPQTERSHRCAGRSSARSAY
jgi:IS5 family transposase